MGNNTDENGLTTYYFSLNENALVSVKVAKFLDNETTLENVITEMDPGRPPDAFNLAKPLESHSLFFGSTSLPVVHKDVYNYRTDNNTINTKMVVYLTNTPNSSIPHTVFQFTYDAESSTNFNFYLGLIKTMLRWLNSNNGQPCNHS
jgi:hypothetical protein